MFAFVQNLGLGAIRPPGLPQGSLRSVCGTTVGGSMPARHVVSSSSTICMSNNPGITLQTLVYNPNPGIASVEDRDLMCYRVIKQVFGNAYVMESERADFYNAESMYRAGQISLREFVRGCAKSETYKRRFFECCGPYRAVELNFKHILGRGPNSQQELSEHVQIIANKGFDAEIDSYIDSEEYEDAFGDDLVPYMRFKGTYSTAEEFNRMCMLYSAPGTTDKSLRGRARAIGIDNPNRVLSLDGAGIPARLVSTIAMNGHSSFLSIRKAIPSRPDLDLGQESSRIVAQNAQPINERAAPRKRVEIAMGSYMYLTDEEAAQYTKTKTEQSKITNYAQREVASAKAQIAALEAKIAEYSQVL